MIRHALLFSSLLLVGCFVPRETASVDADKACTKCHGDSSREGTRAERAAPPNDIFGNTGTEFPGVGAHELHLKGSVLAAPIACTECHVVPEKLGDPGHNDGEATMTFGPIASARRMTPATYDRSARSCDVACHSGKSGVWTKQRPVGELCGTCHEKRPAAPHPQAGDCVICHAEVAAADGGILDPTLHVNGVVNVSDVKCNACHGATENGAPAGAHQKHLAGGAQTRPVGCPECHVVPEKIATPSHPNGGKAEVLASVNWSGNANCTNGCHPAGSPDWSAMDVNLSCTGCHGAPPPAPHPPVTNCALCHPNATGAMGRQFTDRTLHVNGTVEVNVSAACDSCHGSSTNFAPPRDTQGNTDTSLRSVGAHQAHLVGRGLARQVQCTECHTVPAMTVSAGHLNGTVEVNFSGVARANLAAPTWNPTAMTCASAACHDVANWIGPGASGGGQATTPLWTKVDQSQITCDSCHGMPPPLPHVQRTDCEACHLNATAQRTFVRPELHVNGHVDFATP